MDKILAAGEDARVVNVTSLGYETCGVRYEDWNFNVCLWSELANGHDVRENHPLKDDHRKGKITTRGTVMDSPSPPTCFSRSLWARNSKRAEGRHIQFILDVCNVLLARCH